MRLNISPGMNSAVNRGYVIWKLLLGFLLGKLLPDRVGGGSDRWMVLAVPKMTDHMTLV